MNFDMAIFHQTFFEEAADLLADLEGQLLRLEETPNDTEVLNTIFRCAHSIKGGSATFGFTDIAHFTHGLETLLDMLRNGKAHVDGTLIQILLESQDQLKALLAVARGEQGNAPDSSQLEARIQAAIAAASAPNRPQADANRQADNHPAQEETSETALSVRAWRLRLVPGPDTLRQGADPALLLSQLASECNTLKVQCDTSHLPSLAEMDAETCYLAWDAEFETELDAEQILDIFEFIADESEIVLTEQPKASLPQAARETPAKREADFVAPAEDHEAELAEPIAGPAPRMAPADPAAASAAKAETHTLRVSTDKVDKLINLVGELVINQSMLNEVVQDFTMAKLPRLIEAVAEMERASRELQERVMAVRMLPIKHAFGRFPRLVRDLASAGGKRIELKTTGEETELDKTVIEAVADPLTHLVRNSADHGLETPEARRKAGKPEVGTIALNAFHEGGNIVIEISDDGRGLDRDRIYAKALERGLLSESDPVPSDEALYNYIFHPGFSTAAKVTDLSGRGVGMDIVRQAVQALGGSISLSSTPGLGTRFRIRLPLTMAILEGLSLSVGGEVYILPLTSIVESIRPKTGDVRLIAGQMEVAQVRGEILPILRLYQVFGAEPILTDPTQALLVIVENDGRKVALLVDELIGQSQVVIKSLETNYRKVDAIAGATILGDGRVALIVDVPGLVRGILSGSNSFSLAA
ncbi:MAG TPA: chemotaxis protein CheA [Chthonomonadaceae bacterium]|nr:chemotaxis protein CheA [Chthonomonadaceae bacterium]